MAYYTEVELQKIGFKKLGKAVKISRKVSIYDPEKISLDDFARIDDFCVLSGKISIGKYTRICVMCNLAGGEPGITLEDYSALSYGVQVFAQTDDYTGCLATNPVDSERFRYEFKKPIHISKHVLVGASSVIFPGVTLAEGSAIGAMTLVNRSTEAWKIYAGIPAKVIKDREKELLQMKEKAHLENH